MGENNIFLLTDDGLDCLGHVDRSVALDFRDWAYFSLYFLTSASSTSGARSVLNFRLSDICHVCYSRHTNYAFRNSAQLVFS